MSGEQEIAGSQQDAALFQVLMTACDRAGMDRLERFWAILSLRGTMNRWLRLEGVTVSDLQEDVFNE